MNKNCYSMALAWGLVYHESAVVVFDAGQRDTGILRQTAETLIQLKPKIPLEHLAEHLRHQADLIPEHETQKLRELHHVWDSLLHILFANVLHLTSVSTHLTAVSCLKALRLQHWRQRHDRQIQSIGGVKNHRRTFGEQQIILEDRKENRQARRHLWWDL